jgi:hypothetical protein
MVSFRTKNPNFGKILEGLAMEDVGIFCGHSEYLKPVGIFHGHLVYFEGLWSIFQGFGMLYREKSGKPAWLYFVPIH